MKFLNALSFLTIIKIPKKFYAGFYAGAGQLPATLVYFPIVGMLIGILGAAFLGLSSFLLPLILAIILMAGFEVALTGGIHIDGLADLFDGTFSGETDKKRIIEIMKKGNTGVFGVLAIVFSLAIKTAILYFTARALLIPDHIITGFSREGFFPAALEFYHGFIVLLPVIVFAPVFGRLSMLYMFSTYEPVNAKASLSAAFKDRSNREISILSYVYLSIFFIAVLMFSQVGFFNHTLAESFAGNYAGQAGQADLANLTGQAGETTFLLSRSLYAGFGTEIVKALGPAFIFIFFAFKAVLVICLTQLFIAAAGKFFTRRLQGITGDAIGGVCVLTEIFFLLANYLAIRFL